MNITEETLLCFQVFDYSAMMAENSFSISNVNIPQKAYLTMIMPITNK